jgi:hypothetical protein
MAEEAKAAGAEGAKDDVDVVKVAVWFLLVLLVGLTAVLFVLQKYRDDFRAAVEFGEKNLKETAGKYDAVKGLLKTYKDSGADEARRETRTWLKARYTAAGINDGQVTTLKWQEKPSKDYMENFVDVVLKDVPREKAIHFLWNVENMSTKMRTIEMTLRRTPPNTAPEADVWELKASFGYRVPRGFKEGG